MCIAKRLWAKISNEQENGSFLWLSVYQHAIDSMFVAERLYDEFLSPQQRKVLIKAFNDNEALTRKAIMFLCGVHDIGKIAPLFALGSKTSEQQKTFLLDNLNDTGLLNDGLISASYDRQVIRHCFSGAYFLQQWMQEFKGVKKKASKHLTASINGHHGEWKIVGRATQKDLNKEYISGDNSWKNARDTFCSEMSDIAGLTNEDWEKLSRTNLNMLAQMIITGITIMSDWISSNSEFFPLLLSGNINNIKDEPTRISKGIEKLSLPSNYNFEQPVSQDDILNTRFNIHEAQMNNMQSMVFSLSRKLREQDESALIIIQEEMGKGKTEASLIAAENMSYGNTNGVLFALPTQATTNAMLPRFTSWISTLAPELGFAMQHSSAKANKAYDAMRSYSHIDSNENELPHINIWFEGSRKGVLAPFTLCTIDQVLMMALNCRFIALKHLGIGTKTIIIDEVHSSDLYMTCFLNKALEWLAACNVTVIMLSATLSKEQCTDMLTAYYRGANALGEDFDDDYDDYDDDDNDISSINFDDFSNELTYPSISIATKQGLETYAIKRTDSPKKFNIMMRPGWDTDKIVANLYEKIENGGIAGVVCNTVNTAQELYEKALNKKKDDTEIILLHSRYTAADRQKIESSLIDKLGKKRTIETGRPHKAIIIGTQVIEQSLDIDLDYMISYLAPIDLILQRIGREHRHPIHNDGRAKDLVKPKITIVGYDIKDGRVHLDKGSTYVYEKILLLRTLSVLSAYDDKTIYIPNDIERMMDAVYNQDVPINAVGNEDQWEHELDEALTQYEQTKKSRIMQANRFILGSPSSNNDLISLTCNDKTQNDDENASGVRLGIASAQAICLKVDDNGKVRFMSSSSGNTLPDINKCNASDIIDNTVPLPPGVSGVYGEVDKDTGSRYDVLLDELTKEHIEKYRLKSIADSSYAYKKKILVFPVEGSLRIGKYLLSYNEHTGLLVTKD